MCEANQAIDDSNGEVEPIDSWEEEDEAEPEVWFNCYIGGQFANLALFIYMRL